MCTLKKKPIKETKKLQLYDESEKRTRMDKIERRKKREEERKKEVEHSFRTLVSSILIIHLSLTDSSSLRILSFSSSKEI